MSIPGFTAAASLYKSRGQYVAAPIGSSGGIMPQLANMPPGQLEFCRWICEVCRYYNYGCFACWYCAIIIVLGGERA